MPIFHGKSKKDFEHNIKAELKAGKPQPQALAIAYSVKRRGKKMAQGGLAGDVAGQLDKMNAQSDAEAAPMSEHDQNVANDKKINAARANLQSKGYAEGGYIEGAKKQHDSYDSEMGKGMPGKPVALPDEQDEMSQEQKSSEMNRRPLHERIMLARYQAEMEKNGMSDSEMDHFAMGGMADSEMHAGMPGKAISMPDEEDEESQEMKSSEMHRGMPGMPVHLSHLDSDEDEHEMSDLEMGRGLAHGGMAGNPKLQQAYSKGEPKSLSESIIRKKMANGGQVDIELNAMEEGEDSLGSSPLDKMDRYAADKENYDEGMHSEFGDEGDDLQHGEGIMERIRRKRSMK